MKIEMEMTKNDFRLVSVYIYHVKDIIGHDWPQRGMMCLPKYALDVGWLDVGLIRFVFASVHEESPHVDNWPDFIDQFSSLPSISMADYHLYYIVISKIETSLFHVYYKCYEIQSQKLLRLYLA